MSTKTKDEMKREARKVREDTRSLRIRLLELRAAQAQGPKGDRGERGPMGPMPRHEWRTTADGKIEIRFELPTGWGEWSENLRGPRGFGGGVSGSSLPGPQGPPGPPGPAGGGSGDGSVPYFIPLGETFTVPIYRQALFSRTIEADGDIDLSGDLIMV